MVASDLLLQLDETVVMSVIDIVSIDLRVAEHLQ